MKTTIVLTQTISKGWNIAVRKEMENSGRVNEGTIASFTNVPNISILVLAAYRAVAQMYLADSIEFDAHTPDHPAAKVIMEALSLEAN